MDFGLYMTRGERIERFINDKLRTHNLAYENKVFLPVHWLDVVEGVANGVQSSELNVDKSCRDDLMDTVKDDVALGIKMGKMMKQGEECFSATVTDSDNRDLHFFFIAPSEDVVIERLIAAFEKAHKEAES